MNTETPALENLSDRLNFALDQTATKQIDLARAIGVKRQIIQYLCTSKTQSTRYTFEIATALGLNTRWLSAGEGEMFVRDDPKQQFLKTYKSIPVLNTDTLRDVFLYKNHIKNETINEWLPLKTEDENSFAIKMIDSSMEPNFPIGSFVFIKECPNEKLSAHKFVFAYLVKFDTFIIRELVENNSTKHLLPKNNELFNEINVTDEVHILGVVTDCYWHV